MKDKQEVWIRAIELDQSSIRSQPLLRLKFGQQKSHETVTIDFANWEKCDSFLSKIISVPSKDLRDHLRKRLQVDLDSFVDFEVSNLIAR